MGVLYRFLRRTGVRLRLVWIGLTIALKLVRSARYSSGQVVTETVNNAMDGVQYSLFALSSWTSGIAMMAVAAIYMGLIEWRLALCILGYNLVLRIFGTQAERRIRTHAKRAVEVTKENNSLVLSVLANLILVRTYDRGGFFERLLRQKERRTASANFKRSAWGTGITDATWAVCSFTAGSRV